MGLHAANTYKDANRPPESDLPEGASRRLPDGRLLMKDGSITKPSDSAAPHTLHQVKEEKPTVLTRMWRGFKDSV